MEAGQSGPVGPQGNPHPQELILISGEGGYRMEPGARESDSPAVMCSPNTYSNSPVKQVLLVRSRARFFKQPSHATADRGTAQETYSGPLMEPDSKGPGRERGELGDNQ